MPADQLDALLAAVRSTVGSLEAMDGYAGIAVLADRESNRVSVVTYWDTEEAMQASEEAAAKARESVSSGAPGLSVTEVDRLEVVLRERVGPPGSKTFARVVDTRVAPQRLDELVALVRDEAVPVARAQPGFRAAMMSINRATGRAIAASVYDSAAEREASDAALAPVRERVRAAVPSQSTTVNRYEVILAEIKLPATAA
ncbi:MAG TPA: antibiotic biosynthesis monooxygenase [Chloroflexota bacterium]|nr:antibiotic biosynthesis monooxygenase [Chloroflexota bacterium]